ncbi:unnamed protein product [Trifolium pratense]|uniref:Uncharacterized protein n=1 Tax=Trifolium pratense TaxID=57577 RepID=A0ACB0KZF6_TRIPR|nr:unnamed protein product [Trifolium pratense]
MQLPSGKFLSHSGEFISTLKYDDATCNLNEDCMLKSCTTYIHVSGLLQLKLKHGAIYCCCCWNRFALAGTVATGVDATQTQLVVFLYSSPICLCRIVLFWLSLNPLVRQTL